MYPIAVDAPVIVTGEGKRLLGSISTALSKKARASSAVKRWETTRVVILSKRGARSGKTATISCILVKHFVQISRYR